ASFEPVEAAPGAHQRLLHGVVGFERRSEHAVAERGQLGSVLLEPELGSGRIEARRACHARPLLRSVARTKHRTERSQLPATSLKSAPVASVAVASRPYGVSSAGCTIEPPRSTILARVLSVSSAPK